jgi:hypothetical protein
MFFIFLSIKSKIFAKIKKKVIKICISQNLKQTMHTMYDIINNDFHELINIVIALCSINQKGHFSSS